MTATPAKKTSKKASKKAAEQAPLPRLWPWRPKVSVARRPRFATG